MAPPSVLCGVTGAIRVYAGYLQPQRPFGILICSMAALSSGVQIFLDMSDILLSDQSARPIAGPASWLMVSVPPWTPPPAGLA